QGQETPEAAEAVPQENSAPPTLASIHEALCQAFPTSLIEVKPGAVANGRALALAYVDMRAYQARLDEAAGPEGWSVEYRPLGDRAILCRLTILGVTREDVGEADPAEANWATCMVAQSFKRACASFGLGRYLYSLPRLWVEMDGKRIKDPEAAIQQLCRGIKA
ncbi:MAG TPA: Rad52/Rad22 family DNA repair protein, partial [Dehalococcoidia bacterium]|nr:Rad52/Rad22 family DNA repair protein [Dehalococcoidia bacterium]